MERVILHAPTIAAAFYYGVQPAVSSPDVSEKRASARLLAELQRCAGDAGSLIEGVAAAFAEAGLFYGHGTANADDEAAALVFHVMELDHYGDAEQYQQAPTAAQLGRIAAIAGARMATRKPLPYLTGEAWFAGLPFTVDERVLVPRSPLAELIMAGFAPWADPGKIRSVLEIGTGSGCIAVACALELPQSQVTATDISADALAVAAVNVARHDVAERVTLVETDLSQGLQGPFDVIITNPPYVPDSEEAELPAEYSHEPALGLYSGADGLDSARRILQDSPALLSEDGILVLEVGAQWPELEQAFPALPMTWLDFAHGGTGVAVLTAADLRHAF